LGISCESHAALMCPLYSILTRPSLWRPCVTATRAIISMGLCVNGGASGSSLSGWFVCRCVTGPSANRDLPPWKSASFASRGGGSRHPRLRFHCACGPRDQFTCCTR
jgi:hypothetical protein